MRSDRSANGIFCLISVYTDGMGWAWDRTRSGGNTRHDILLLEFWFWIGSIAYI